MNLIFTYVLVNMCNEALDLSIGKLIVKIMEVNLFCKWLISAEDENSYITLEFQNINVSHNSLENFYHTKMSEIFRLSFG